MIKKGVKVKILSGKDKNKDGDVIEIDRKNNRAKVKGVNMVKKHVKTTKEKKGGIISKESFINLSNLKLLDEKAKSKKVKAIKLLVSAPFHCKYMKPTAKILEEAFKNLTFKNPLIPIITNFTAKPFINVEDLKSSISQFAQWYVPSRFSLFNSLDPGGSVPSCFKI